MFFRIIFPLLMLLMGLGSCAANTSYPKAKKGIIDLRNWDVNDYHIVKLDGEWEFYWKQFIQDTSEYKNDTINRSFITVPGLWNKHEDVINSGGSEGYASYKLTLLVDALQDYTFKYVKSATSCDVFIDGTLMFSSGEVGVDAESSVPSFKSTLINYKPQSEKVEMVLQISNFSHWKGGQWEPLTIGLSQTQIRQWDLRLFINLVVIGCIFMIGLYYIILFTKFTHDKSFLYFGLFALANAARLLVTGGHTIYMLGDVGWVTMIRISYMSFYLSVLLFLLFLKELFPTELNKNLIKIIALPPIVFSLSVIFLKPLLFTQGMVYYQVFTLIASMYGLWIILIAFKNKREGALSLLIGFFLLFLTFLNDVLKSNEIIFSISLVSIGLTLFIFMKANILAERMRFTFKANEDLNKILKRQNLEYEKLNNDFLNQNKQLQVAKERAEESDRLKSAFLANMSHEIRSPMNGVVGFANFLDDPDFSENEKSGFVSIIKERSRYLLGIINDIIDISKIETGQIVINKDEVSPTELISEIHSNYSMHSSKINVELLKNIHPNVQDLKIETDEIKLKQILDNLLSNAVKFTQKGSIEIECKKEASELLFMVKDTGIGMTEEEANCVFDRFKQANDEIPIQFGGSGLGLAISKAYVEKLGGLISVSSKPNEGTIFSFTHPIKTIN